MKIRLTGWFLKKTTYNGCVTLIRMYQWNAWVVWMGMSSFNWTVVKREIGQICSSSCLIWHAEWKPLELPKPTQVVNLKQYRIPVAGGGMAIRISQLINWPELIIGDVAFTSLTGASGKSLWLSLTTHCWIWCSFMYVPFERDLLACYSVFTETFFITE